MFRLQYLPKQKYRITYKQNILLSIKNNRLAIIICTIYFFIKFSSENEGEKQSTIQREAKSGKFKKWKCLNISNLHGSTVLG